MSTFTLSDLVSPYSLDDAKAEVLTLASKAGFPTTSWQDRSVPKAIIDVVSPLIAEVKATQKTLANAAFRKTAHLAGVGYLDLLAEDFYGLQRQLASVCVRSILVTNNSGASLSISPGSLLIRASGTELYFESSSTVTIASGASSAVEFTAKEAGSAHSATFGGYEIVSGATSAAFADVAIVTEGYDEESDDAMNARCDAIFGALSHAGPNRFYETIARNFSREITRVKVLRNTPSAGSVTVVIGGDLAPCPSGTASALEAVLDPKPNHGGLAPDNIDVYVQDMALYLVPIVGTFAVEKASLDSAKVAFFKALAAYEKRLGMGSIAMLRTLLKIGMESMPESEKNDFYISDPVANVGSPPGTKIKFVPSITWVET